MILIFILFFTFFRNEVDSDIHVFIFPHFSISTHQFSINVWIRAMRNPGIEQRSHFSQQAFLVVFLPLPSSHYSVSFHLSSSYGIQAKFSSALQFRSFFCIPFSNCSPVIPIPGYFNLQLMFQETAPNRTPKHEIKCKA